MFYFQYIFNNIQGDECAAKGVGFEGAAEIDQEVLTEMLEQFHRESRTIPKRRTDIDRVSLQIEKYLPDDFSNFDMWL
jgi:hypothetical protein